MLVAHAVIPDRSRAKGIDCIMSGLVSVQIKVDDPAAWFPIKTNDNVAWFRIALDLEKKRILERLLPYLPSLEFPIPNSIAIEFTRKFLWMAKGQNWVPELISKNKIIIDRGERWKYYADEIKYLDSEILEKRVTLLKGDRRRMERRGADGFFSRQEAIRYIEAKGLQDVLSKMREDSKEGIEYERILETHSEYLINNNEREERMPADLFRHGILWYCDNVVPRNINNTDLDEKYKEETRANDFISVQDVDDVEVNNSNSLSKPYSEDENGHSKYISNFENENISDIAANSSQSKLLKTDENSVKEIAKIQATAPNNKVNENSIQPDNISGINNHAEILETIDFNGLLKKLDIKRATLYKLIKVWKGPNDEKFPRSFKIGGVKKWKLKDIVEWQELAFSMDAKL